MSHFLIDYRVSSRTFRENYRRKLPTNQPHTSSNVLLLLLLFSNTVYYLFCPCLIDTSPSTLSLSLFLSLGVNSTSTQPRNRLLQITALSVSFLFASLSLTETMMMMMMIDSGVALADHSSVSADRCLDIIIVEISH